MYVSLFVLSQWIASRLCTCLYLSYHSGHLVGCVHIFICHSTVDGLLPEYVSLFVISQWKVLRLCTCLDLSYYSGRTVGCVRVFICLITGDGLSALNSYAFSTNDKKTTDARAKTGCPADRGGWWHGAECR